MNRNAVEGGKPVRPSLENVTLVAVTSVALSATIEALQASMRQAQFSQALLLSDRPPPAGSDPGITWREIPRLRSRSDYSRFMLCDLAEHIDTSHALCVQWDGFVLSGKAWEPSFLDYDYIGAVWPQFTDDHNVGNGGFSLRSRRLLEAAGQLPFEGHESEDIVIARIGRSRLEEQGIRFAPAAVARRFAYERTRPSGEEFGFHGAFNLVRYLAPRDNLRMFRALEPGMLSTSERFELFRWALVRGQIKLAVTVLAKLALQ